MTWLYIPSKSAQVWGCWAKDSEPGSSTWASKLAPSVTSSGKHMPPLFWQRAWKKAPWTRHLCGPTFSPSTLQHGVEQWIASLRDSRAKTSALLESGPGLMASEAGCSSTSLTLPTLAVRDTSFWRTSQASLLPPPPLWTKPKALLKNAQPPESWENWPTAGGMRSGSLFQRPTWVPVMGAAAGSAGRGEGWPTPRADSKPGERLDGTGGKSLDVQGRMWLTPNVPNGGRSVPEALVQSKGTTDTGEKRTVGLESQSKYWATPTTNEHTGAGQAPNKTGAPNLRTQVDGWPTPRGTDGTKGGPNQAGSKGDLMLPSAAAQWPTPAARDAKGANSEEHCTITGGGRKHMDQLSNFVAHSLHLAQPIPDGQTSSESGPDSLPPSQKRLNPAFGELLMGWPTGHTIAEPRDCGASEMELWRSALQRHLCSFFDGQE